MASVRARKDTGKLFLDFVYMGRRCREQTPLMDSAKNRRKLKKLLAQIEEQIALGMFDYGATFPKSKRAAQFPSPAVAGRAGVPAAPPPMASLAPMPEGPTTPLFSEFAETWFAECEPGWRPRYRETVRGALDQHLLPAFGTRPVHEIRRADILAFRAELAKKPGRGGRRISNVRINSVMLWLSQILNEASLRFEFPPATTGIKPLKTPKPDVEPFSLDEVNKIVDTCRPEWRPYFITRFFTGLRSGEIHGLRWHCLDFERNQILIRETLVDGEIQQGAKTYDSCRDIAMLPLVREALLIQRAATPEHVEWVFHASNHQPIDTGNFTARIWKPLLGYLGLRYRRPYQTRHTTATLLLAAGESPEWIARLMGHANTEMLFTRYSRYVQDLTRKDGSAIGQLLDQRGPRMRPEEPCKPRDSRKQTTNPRPAAKPGPSQRRTQ
ncbi:MAG: Arm DNA-binding domain-containing protein [Wenzhouxiangella sp.]